MLIAIDTIIYLNSRLFLDNSGMRDYSKFQIIDND